MKSLIVYFGLSCLISWTVWLPLYLPAFGINTWPGIPFLHGLGALGPSIAALLTSLIFNGSANTLQFIKSGFRLKSRFYIGIALLSPLLLHIAAILFFSLETSSFVDLAKMGRSREFTEWSAAAFFAHNFVFFGIGEETGWRGFALPRLQQRFNAFNSSLLLTLPWAAWHWPLFLFRPGYTAMSIVEITGWLFSLLMGSVLLTWLFNSSKGSILACAVFHAFVNIAFTSYISNEQIVSITGLLITVYAAAVVIIFKPANLASGNRIEAL